MQYEIPDNDGSQDEILSLLTASALLDLGYTSTGVGVVSGLVASPGGSARQVSFTSGTIIIDRQTFPVSSGSVTLAANTSGFDRLDVIEVDSAGTISAITGTLGNGGLGSSTVVPREPARTVSGGLPSKVKLATVLVKDAQGVLPSSQILDRRIYSGVVPQFLGGEGAPENSFGADGDWYLDGLTQELYGPKVDGEWPEIPVLLVGGVQVVSSTWVPADGVPAGTPPGTKILRRMI